MVNELDCSFEVYLSTNIHEKDLNSFPQAISSGVMIIVIGNGHGDTSSNPGRDRLNFTSH